MSETDTEAVSALDEIIRIASEHQTLKQENQELRVRVARLEGAVEMLTQVYPYGESPHNNPKLAYDLFYEKRDAALRILQESEQQSLAEVRADTLREASEKIPACPHHMTPSYWLQLESRRILQEAKDA